MQIIPWVDRKIVKLIEPDFENGPWICGGACIQWFQGKEVSKYSDIDIYFKNDAQRTEFVSNLTKKSLEDNAKFKFEHVVDTANAHTFNIKIDSNTWKLQAIKLYSGDTIQDVLDQFDINACKISTDGHQFVFGSDNTVQDILYQKINIPVIKKNSISRVIKYMGKGYDLTEDAFDLLFNSNADLITDFNYDPNTEYNNE